MLCRRDAKDAEHKGAEQQVPHPILCDSALGVLRASAAGVGKEFVGVA